MSDKEIIIALGAIAGAVIFIKYFYKNDEEKETKKVTEKNEKSDLDTAEVTPPPEQQPSNQPPTKEEIGISQTNIPVSQPMPQQSVYKKGLGVLFEDEVATTAPEII